MMSNYIKISPKLVWKLKKILKSYQVSAGLFFTSFSYKVQAKTVSGTLKRTQTELGSRVGASSLWCAAPTRRSKPTHFLPLLPLWAHLGWWLRPCRVRPGPGSPADLTRHTPGLLHSAHCLKCFVRRQLRIEDTRGPFLSFQNEWIYIQWRTNWLDWKSNFNYGRLFKQLLMSWSNQLFISWLCFEASGIQMIQESWKLVTNVFPDWF